MQRSEDRSAILATLPDAQADLLVLTWQRMDMMRYLLRHPSRALVRHAWRHPSVVWAIGRAWWLNWRLNRRLRGRLV